MMERRSHGRLLALQMKRVFHILPMTLCLSALLLLAASLFVFSAWQEDSTGDNRTRIRVGVVGDASDTYMGIGIEALQNLDDSQYFMELVSMTEEEASKALIRGEINCYLRVPEDFVDSLVRGDNSPATFVSSPGQEDIGTAIMADIINAISGLVLHSQAGIYTLQNYMRASGLPDVNYHVNALNMDYILSILSRNRFFAVEETGMAGQLSAYGYYLCGFLVLFLLLWGLTCNSFFLNRDIALTKLMIAKGYGAGKQVVTEYIAYAVLMLISVGAFFALLFPVINRMELPVREWMALETGERLSFLLGLLPVAVLMAAFQFFLYECSFSVLSALLLQFIGTLSVGFLSGCLYPVNFFPESVQRVAGMLPAGIAREYLSLRLCGESAFQKLLLMGLYAVCFVAASVALRRKKAGGV